MQFLSGMARVMRRLGMDPVHQSPFMDFVAAGSENQRVMHWDELSLTLDGDSARAWIDMWNNKKT